MGSRKLIYGGIYVASLGCGIAKGYCREKGIDMSAGLDALLTYGPPAVGILAGFVREVAPFLDGPSNLGSIAAIPMGALGASAGGLGAIISEAIGYGAGYLAGKLS